MWFLFSLILYVANGVHLLQGGDVEPPSISKPTNMRQIDLDPELDSWNVRNGQAPPRLYGMAHPIRYNEAKSSYIALTYLPREVGEWAELWSRSTDEEDKQSWKQFQDKLNQGAKPGWDVLTLNVLKHIELDSQIEKAEFRQDEEAIIRPLRDEYVYLEKEIEREVSDRVSLSRVVDAMRATGAGHKNRVVVVSLDPDHLDDSFFERPITQHVSEYEQWCVSKSKDRGLYKTYMEWNLPEQDFIFKSYDCVDMQPCADKVVGEAVFSVTEYLLRGHPVIVYCGEGWGRTGHILTSVILYLNLLLQVDSMNAMVKNNNKQMLQKAKKNLHQSGSDFVVDSTISSVRKHDRTDYDKKVQRIWWYFSEKASSVETDDQRESLIKFYDSIRSFVESMLESFLAGNSVGQLKKRYVQNWDSTYGHKFTNLIDKLAKVFVGN